jgi:hypothetical protein
MVAAIAFFVAGFVGGKTTFYALGAAFIAIGASFIAMSGRAGDRAEEPPTT